MDNISRFRLRAFEYSFLKPIMTYVDSRGDEFEKVLESDFWQASFDVSPHFAVWNDDGNSTSRDMTYASLLAEAVEWTRRGVNNGYFSAELKPVPIVIGGNDLRDSNLVFRRLALASRRPGPGKISYLGPNNAITHETFAHQLDQSIEELDADRIELLRIVLFSSNKEWESRIRDLQQLGYGRGARGEYLLGNGFDTVGMAVKFADNMAWALFERDGGLRPVNAPFDWRTIAGMARARPDRVERLERERLIVRRSLESFMDPESRTFPFKTATRRWTGLEAEIGANRIIGFEDLF